MFKINKYLALDLQKGKTVILLEGSEFLICKAVFVDINGNMEELVYDTIDEVVDDESNRVFLSINPEEEFWVHCSNLQAWVENNYDTALLHSNIAFPLLKKLSEVGDSKARRCFKDEIVKKIESGYIPTVIYIVMSHLFDFFSQEEFEVLIESIRGGQYFLKEKYLDLIYSFDIERRSLSSNDLIFLIEHPCINLVELLIKFGRKYFEEESDFIGDFRKWINYILDTLIQKEPEFIERIIRDLIKEQKITVKYISYINDKTGVKETKVDYSIMDDFSIMLYNTLKYNFMKLHI